MTTTIASTSSIFADAGELLNLEVVLPPLELVQCGEATVHGFTSFLTFAVDPPAAGRVRSDHPARHGRGRSHRVQLDTGTTRPMHCSLPSSAKYRTTPATTAAGGTRI